MTTKELEILCYSSTVDLTRDGFSERVVEIDQRDEDAITSEKACCRCSQTRCSTRNNRSRSFNFHL